MRKIDKGYAIIYVDDNNELSLLNNFVSNDMIDEYYTTPGAIQWNYYIIIPKNDLTEDRIKEIELDDRYARKYVLNEEDIAKFIEDKFPDNNNNSNKLLLITGDSWEETLSKVNDNTQLKTSVIHGSFHRYYNSMDTLSYLDDARSEILKNDYDICLYTHIEDEISWIKKKFDFLGEQFIKIN